MAKNLAKITAYAVPVMVTLLLFALLNLGLGFLHPPPTRMEAILAILQRHPSRIWSLKPKMHTTFAGSALYTDAQGYRIPEPGLAAPGAKTSNLRICCLGDSLTFGWGVSGAQSYPAVLEAALKKKWPSRGIEVINMAVPGYTSLQGLKLLQEEVLALNPDLVTLSFGVNDVTKARFLNNNGLRDALVPEGNPVWIRLLNWRDRTNLYRWAQHIWLSRNGNNLKAQAYWLKASQDMTQRVLPEEFACNIRHMLKTLQARHIAVLIIKMPLNLPHAPRISPARKHAAEALFLKARQSLSGGAAPATGCTYLLQSLELDPLNPGRCFQAYDLCLKAKNPGAAQQALNHLFKLKMYLSSDRHREYNAITSAVAREQGAALADIESAFQRCSGQYLFNHPVTDAYHPNAKGHQVIAAEIIKILSAWPRFNPAALPAASTLQP